MNPIQTIKKTCFNHQDWIRMDKIKEMISFIRIIHNHTMKMKIINKTKIFNKTLSLLHKINNK